MSIDKKNQHREQLIQARALLKELLGSLNDQQWQTPIISEDQTWTAADIVAHLFENEIGMSIHVHKIRQGKETVPEDFNLDKWNAGLQKRVGNLSREELLTKLDEAREKTLQVLDSIKDDEWELQGRHPLQGMATITDYYAIMAGHDTWHTNDIKKALNL